MMKPKEVAKKYYLLILLFAIMYFAILVRWSTSNFTYILDYDPWWFFRYAQYLVQGNLIPPRWDILSYFPPGRPVDFYLGWSYTIAVFYDIVHLFSSISLMSFGTPFANLLKKPICGNKIGILFVSTRRFSVTWLVRINC